MPRPCSLELRKRVVSSRREAADWFEVSPRFGNQMDAAPAATGSIGPEPSGGSVLPVHRVAAVREVIEAAGAKLRPKYSPDLNPIEQAFSKLKAHLRKAAEPTIPRLSRRIGALVAAFSRQECTNYFRHAG